jgi:hypothetical protein
VGLRCPAAASFVGRFRRGAFVALLARLIFGGTTEIMKEIIGRSLGL